MSITIEYLWKDRKRYFGMPLSFTRYCLSEDRLFVSEGFLNLKDDEVLLDSRSVEDLTENDYAVLRENDTLRTLLQNVMQSGRNVFPVISEKGELLGVIRMNTIRKFILSQELYDVILVYDIMEDTGPILAEGDSLNDAALLFDRLGVNQLPVVSSGRKYKGFIAKNQVYDNYRKMLHKKQDLF